MNNNDSSFTSRKISEKARLKRDMSSKVVDDGYSTKLVEGQSAGVIDLHEYFNPELYSNSVMNVRTPIIVLGRK